MAKTKKDIVKKAVSHAVEDKTETAAHEKGETKTIEKTEDKGGKEESPVAKYKNLKK